MLKERLLEMAKEIRTQDNLSTAEPIYVVRQKKRIYGFAAGYSDNVAYLDDEGQEQEPSAKTEELERQYEDGELDEDEDEDFPALTRTRYIDIEENVQYFFTRVGAQAYLDSNKHNMNKPFIYVESAFRNYEWQAIRQLLLDTPVQTESVDSKDVP